MRCDRCWERMPRRTVVVYTKVGELTVENRSLVVRICTICSVLWLTEEQARRVDQQAVLVAFRDAQQVTGAMVRGARRLLGFTQVAFSEALGTTPESISRWERGERESPHYLRDQILRLALERLAPRAARARDIALRS